ncbi:MAG: DUF421 domain-containing protein [Oscillospiraceae bacterium]|nr:DUF421 domain-containing protein [Oscillospiraceae bacterium]
MIITVIRVTILYAVVMAAIRLMGKRQVGELQPTELVVTILLSELVAIPIQDNSIPMATSLVSAAVLVGYEILSSVIAVKSSKYRRFTQGNSILVIKDGKLRLNELQRLRISLDDLMEAIRQKDIFDISEVEYCIVETTGKVSVLPKPQYRQPTVGDMRLTVEDTGLPFVVIYDGERIYKNYQDVQMTDKRLDKILKNEKTDAGQVMLLTVNKLGEVNCLRKEAVS